MTLSVVQVEALVTFLNEKRFYGQRVNVLLGNRAGVLYDGKLYDALKRHVLSAEPLQKSLSDTNLLNQPLLTFIERVRAINHLSRIEQYKECYRILSRDFNEKGVRDILSDALHLNHFREEDQLLATLMKAELFGTIIMANFDTSLEDACESIELKESYDYTLFICSSSYEDDDEKENKKKDDEDNKKIKQHRRCGRIIKVFGDSNSADYKVVGREFRLRPHIRQFLAEEMAEETIILGYDQNWDDSLEGLFREKGKLLWYINEEKPSPDTELARVLDARNSNFVKIEGNYREFLQTLLDPVARNVDWQPDLPIPLPLAQPQNSPRKKVFICYSHEDKSYMETCRKWLKVALRSNIEKGFMDVHDIWADTDILPGDTWKEEIKKAIYHTQLAIVLVSADFWNSDFIHETELPMLYQAEKEDKLRIVPILLRPGPFDNTELSEYQAINDGNEILSGLKQHEEELIWYRLVKKVMDILRPKMN